MEYNYYSQATVDEQCDRQIINQYGNPRYVTTHYKCNAKNFLIIYDMLQLKQYRLNQMQVLAIFISRINSHGNSYLRDPNSQI